MTTSFNITLNGQPHSIQAGTTLADLLSAVRPDLDLSKAALATAVNGRHVARTARTACMLQPDDQITTFEPISGG
ncbi:MAG: sulfur carrier protein ThiS [Alcaligenaceae bacterium]|nr:sulfur carrier protein ThiS [Alcaligenaceae bacterium]